MTGNGWDSNDNSLNLYLRTTPEPQNSLSMAEFPFSGGGGGPSGGALRVMGSFPMTGMTNVPLDMKFIGFGFNKPVDPTTVTASTVSFKIVADGAASGSNLCATVTYNPLAGNTEPSAKCNLTSSLSPSTSYVFQVTNGVTDLGGAGASALDQDSFSDGNQNYYATSTTGAAGQTFTSTIPPTVVGTSPFMGSTNVPSNLAKISVEFNQMDGFIADKELSFRHLLGILKQFALEIAGASKVRFYPDYYPFTEPSVQLSAKHPELGWIEFAGAGMFRPEITENLGIKEPIIAWGMGIDRLAMFKLGIKDIRHLFSESLEYLRNSKIIGVEQ